MERGEIYLVVNPPNDPRPARPFLVVSRDAFLKVPYSTVACVPIYSTIQGLETEVPLDVENGLKDRSGARCDEVTSVQRRLLRTLVGRASSVQMERITVALALALAIPQGVKGP